MWGQWLIWRRNKGEIRRTRRQAEGGQSEEVWRERLGEATSWEGREESWAGEKCGGIKGVIMSVLSKLVKPQELNKRFYTPGFVCKGREQHWENVQTGGNHDGIALCCQHLRCFTSVKKCLKSQRKDFTKHIKTTSGIISVHMRPPYWRNETARKPGACASYRNQCASQRLLRMNLIHGFHWRDEGCSRCFSLTAALRTSLQHDSKHHFPNATGLVMSKWCW